LGTAQRDLVVDEIKQIIAAQRAFGNDALTDAFEQEFIGNGEGKEAGIFTAQRDFDEGPGEGSPYGGDQIEKMVGWCTFEKEEHRAAKGTYTFQYFELLSKLNNMKIQEFDGEDWKELNPDQRQMIIDKAFTKDKLQYADIKKLLKLEPEAKFNLLSYGSKTEQEKTEKTDFVVMRNYDKVRKALGREVYEAMPNSLKDEIGTILTTHSSDKSRRRVFADRLSLTSAQVEALLPLTMTQYGHLSLKAMRKIIPYLEMEYIYSDACKEAGYDFRFNKIDRDYIHENVSNPVVKRAVSQCIKVVNQLIREYGKPDAINIEFSRELGKNFAERKKIEKNQKENMARNESVANELRENGIAVNGENITRLKLWREQGNMDPYTGKEIQYGDVFYGHFDVDHIIPYSISFDDSFGNKVLVSSAANREKGNRIPMEYLANDPIRIQNLEKIAGTIRNYHKREKLLKKKLSPEDVEGWKSRNINDTRYIARLLRNYFKQNIDFAEKESNSEKVAVNNGTVTARMRARWGLGPKHRDNDRHHAMDAVVVACMTPAFVRRVTVYSKRQEVRFNKSLWNEGTLESDIAHMSLEKREEYERMFSKAFPQPWEGFRDELNARLSDNPKELIKNIKNTLGTYTDAEIEKLKPMFVVRRPNKKITGPAHLDTIRSGKLLNEGKSLSRVSISKLKLNKNGEIGTGNAEFYKSDDNGWMSVYNALKTELEKNDGSGEKAFPDSVFTYTQENGQTHTVRKVKVVQKSTLQAVLNDGKAMADNGSMVRIDVFRTPKKYVLIPVYVKDTVARELPNRACIANKSYEEWYELSTEDQFIFSLYQNDIIHIQHKSGIALKYSGEVSGPEKITDFIGYFTGMNINTASISIKANDNSYTAESIGVASLPLFNKMQVDYLGNLSKVSERNRQTFSNMKR
jgi:CRISPR-associated endonuclease Csn1